MNTPSRIVTPERYSDNAGDTSLRLVGNLSEAEGATPKTALVFLIFLVAGPPLGALLIWAVLLIWAIISHNPPSVHHYHLQMVGISVLASYAVGGLQSLFVGGVAAIVQSMSRAGLVPFRPVLVACLLAGAAYPVFTILKNQSLPYWEMLLLFFGLSVGSGILCWLICNAVLWPFRRRSANQAMA
ncbi:hypothetical protein LJR220_006287 [Bradyrhizobium sp. LjRoot220]|uniref:hypothetical protein n=1 Tax=Bradyrhizobium sp. LjRoot220 TaxID=3342284 RepID=UPI003ECE2EC9